MINFDSVSKEEIDKQYSPSVWSHRMDAEQVVHAHVNHCLKSTEAARRAFRAVRDVAYAKAKDDSSLVVDIYYPNSVDLNSNTVSQVLIYFHGGYWQVMGLVSYRSRVFRFELFA